MTSQANDYTILNAGTGSDGEALELTEFELGLIMGGADEPGYQQSDPNANGWDLRGSASGHSGAEGAGGQGGDTHAGSDPSGGAGGAGGGSSHPATEPYPAPPTPTQGVDSMFMYWVNRTIQASEPYLRDGSGLLSIPILQNVVFPPRPQA